MDRLDTLSNKPLDKAFVVDTDVLRNLLSRNWCAHGRTRYFQKTATVVRAIDRYNVLGIRQRMRSVQLSLQQSKTKRQQEWVLGDGATLQDKQSQKLQEELLELQETLVNGLPEILSRIHHASAALFVEIARGYFMPLCTVAIAALARVRVLIMRLGRECLVELQSYWNQWGALQERIGSEDAVAAAPLSAPQVFEDAMNAFAEVDVNARLSAIQRRSREETWRSLGIQTDSSIKHKGKPSLSMKPVSSKTVSSAGTVETHEGAVESQQTSNYALEGFQSLQEDVGESVDIRIMGNAVQTTMKPSVPTREDTGKGRQAKAEGNTDCETKMQAKRTKHHDQIQKKKRKGNGEQEVRDKAKKKKKRKKESKKKDVFDEIFGGL